MKNSDMPAMPQSFAMNNEECGTVISHLLEEERQQVIGLTKREDFASKAMHSVLDKYNPWTEGDFDSSDYEIAAKHAVGLADALLKALEE